jgi:hypothetical protein
LIVAFTWKERKEKTVCNLKFYFLKPKTVWVNLLKVTFPPVRGNDILLRARGMIEQPSDSNRDHLPEIGI